MNCGVRYGQQKVHWSGGLGQRAKNDNGRQMNAKPRYGPFPGTSAQIQGPGDGNGLQGFHKILMGEANEELRTRGEYHSCRVDQRRIRKHPRTNLVDDVQQRELGKDDG